MRVSQNGWPALDSGSSKLHKWVVPGTGRHFVLRNGSAGFLLIHFILWFHERVEDIDKGIWDDWGWAPRPIRGSTTTLSNHASGTALDVNATKYPLGTVLMKAWMVVKIRARLVFYRGCLRWGGDYNGRKDQMHFEIDKSLSRCERRARRLANSPRGRRILDANPGQRKVIFS